MTDKIVTVSQSLEKTDNSTNKMTTHCHIEGKSHHGFKSKQHHSSSILESRTNSGGKST